jgi:activator of 2-hydroxyglutaryl-CoA dehydratase
MKNSSETTMVLIQVQEDILTKSVKKTSVREISPLAQATIDVLRKLEDIQAEIAWRKEIQ